MPQTHVTKPGDTLRKIAQHYYGDDSLWRKIYQANKKTIGADPALIQVGAKLRIPDVDGAARTHVVKAGDSLSSIAERYYGDGTLWKTIYQANKKTIGDDPRVIQVGWKLTIPAIEGAGAAKTHLTKEGDTLYTLARHYYGDDSFWKTIYQANKKAIGPNPDVLPPRIKLKIPAVESAAATKTHVTKEGDTLYSPARHYYGDDSLWKKIHQANKKAIGPNPDVLPPRIKLKIPPK